MLALLIIAVTSAWAQDEVTVAPTANANEWTLEMPDADVELEVTYYTDEELAEMEEAAFTAGVELTKASNGEWTLAEMPGFDIELEMEYETALALNEVDDNTATLAEWNGYEADLTLTRTLVAGDWNTLAVPFSADAVTLGLAAAKELESATLEGQTLTLNFKDATSLVAGKPYLVKVAADVENPIFDGVTVSNVAVPTETEVIDFIPTLGKTLVTGPAGNESSTEAVLFLADNNELKNPTVVNDPAEQSSYMMGFRAYFQLKNASAARSFILNFGDDVTTGIEAIDHSSLNIDHSVYDLQGCRVSGSAQRGLFIVNGKKVVIK